MASHDPTGGGSPAPGADDFDPEFLRRFPDLHQWHADLAPKGNADLAVPPSADFVARTLAALADAGLLAAPEGGRNQALTAAQLQAFAVPEPSPDFVAATMRAIAADHRQRLQSLLAKYIVPEPSPTFVQCTLQALAETSPALQRTHARVPLRRTAGILLAVAAALWLWFGVLAPSIPPVRTRDTTAVSPAFSHQRAESPLPAALGMLLAAADPDALPSGAPDGNWLLQQMRVR